MQKRWVEDCLLDQIRPLWVSSDAFWIDQHSGNLPELHQQDSHGKAWYFCHCISGWYPNLHRERERKPRLSSALGPQPIEEILSICQSEEMSISSGRSLIPRLYTVFARYLYRRWEDQSSRAVAWTQISKRHSGFLYICQFLLAIYPRF